MRYLNKKGFTLIELLAVIVILAVVMGVATTSVLSAMNNSRKSSLQNSAATAANAFNVAYSEFMISNSKELMGLSEAYTTKILNLTDIYENLTPAVGEKLNISIGLAAATNVNYLYHTSRTNTTSSFVYYDVGTSKFEVCLVAHKKGSYYVDTAKFSAATPIKNSENTTIKNIAANYMFACSNGQHSWT